MKKAIFLWCFVLVCALFASHANAAPQLQPLVILTIERSDTSFSVAGDPLFRDGYVPRGKPLIPLPFTLSINNNEGASLHKESFDFPWLATEGGSSPQQEKRVTLTLPWPEEAKQVRVTDREGNLFLEHVLARFSVAESEPATDAYEWVAGEGIPGPALEILFLGDDYEGDEEKFATDVAAHTEALLGIEPYATSTHLILIYRATSVENDLGCAFTDPNIPQLLTCDNIAVFNAAAAAPYDEIIVLVNTDTYGGGALFAGELEPVPYTYAVVSSAVPYVTRHEAAGHSIIGAMDEYIYGGNGAPLGPNCAYEGCVEFEGIPEAECISGCGFTNLFRSHDTCLMMDMSGVFCPACLSRAKTVLAQYESDGEDTTDPPNDDGDDDNDEEGDDDTASACEAAEAAFEACKDAKSVFACMEERRLFLEECF